MKSLSALVLIGCIALASCGMSDEEMAMLIQLSESCIEKTGVPKDLVMKAKDGAFVSDPKMMEYTFCMLNTSGFISDDGEYQIDMMKTVIGKNYGADVASKAVDECTTFQGDKLEKAFKTAECLYNKKQE